MYMYDNTKCVQVYVGVYAEVQFEARVRQGIRMYDGLMMAMRMGRPRAMQPLGLWKPLTNGPLPRGGWWRLGVPDLSRAYSLSLNQRIRYTCWSGARA